MEEKSNISDFIQNPKIIALKKLLFQVLKDKYVPYDDVTTRIGHNLITESDYRSFAKMINELYDAGYVQCINDYKDQLAKYNIKVNVNQKNLADNR